MCDMQAVSAACRSSTSLADVASGQLSSLYLPDPAALQAAGAYSWDFVPSGAQSLLIQHAAVARIAHSTAAAVGDGAASAKSESISEDHSNSAGAAATCLM